MIRLNSAYILFLMLVFLWNTGDAQDLFSAENSKRFAKYLLSTQQYELAAREYERILNMEPNDTAVYHHLLSSYRLGNICQSSFRNLELLNVDNFFGNEQVASEFLKLSLTCNCCYQKIDFASALGSLSPADQAFYKLGRFIFSESRDSLLWFSDRNHELLQMEYPDLFSKVGAIGKFKPKKPALAAVMSAIVPGSGKAYTGYWGDAAMSLMFVTSNAWLSYKGFNKKGVKSANGWIFGSLSMGFYIGNIWGSAKAAKTYNRIEYEKLYKDAKSSVYNRF